MRNMSSKTAIRSYTYTQRELATPVVASAKFCRRNDGEVSPNSSHDCTSFGSLQVVARLAKDPTISAAALMAPIRANTGCCQDGIIAPGG